MSERSKLTAYFSVRRMFQNAPMECGPVERNVLLLMAGWADPDGTNILQSYDTIREVTGYSKSAVRLAVEFWLTANILILIKAGGGRGHAPQYAIDLTKVETFIVTDKGAAPEHLSDNKGAVEKHLSDNAKVPPETTKSAAKVQKGAVERHPPSLPSLPIGEAVRKNQVKHIEGCPPHAVKKPVHPSTSFKELVGKKEHTPPTWVKGKLLEDLYRGIHHKKISDAFFDSRHL